jgi:hypothetical protein
VRVFSLGSEIADLASSNIRKHFFQLKPETAIMSSSLSVVFGIKARKVCQSELERILKPPLPKQKQTCSMMFSVSTQ